jgi:hypothetical protein
MCSCMTFMTRRCQVKKINYFHMCVCDINMFTFFLSDCRIVSLITTAEETGRAAEVLHYLFRYVLQCVLRSVYVCVTCGM